MEKDRESNIAKRPAVRRLMLLDKLDAMLRRVAVHENFVTDEGLTHLFNWLVEMPDGTYPNQRIVTCVMN